MTSAAVKHAERPRQRAGRIADRKSGALPADIEGEHATGARWRQSCANAGAEGVMVPSVLPNPRSSDRMMRDCDEVIISAPACVARRRGAARGRRPVDRAAPAAARADATCARSRPGWRRCARRRRRWPASSGRCSAACASSRSRARRGSSSSSGPMPPWPGRAPTSAAAGARVAAIEAELRVDHARDPRSAGPHLQAAAARLRPAAALARSGAIGRSRGAGRRRWSPGAIARGSSTSSSCAQQRLGRSRPHPSANRRRSNTSSSGLQGEEAALAEAERGSSRAAHVDPRAARHERAARRRADRGARPARSLGLVAALDDVGRGQSGRRGAAAGASLGPGTMDWPVPGRVEARFGRETVEPVRHGRSSRNGIEIGAETGTPVQAVQAGPGRLCRRLRRLRPRRHPRPRRPRPTRSTAIWRRSTSRKDERIERGRVLGTVGTAPDRHAVALLRGPHRRSSGRSGTMAQALNLDFRPRN